MQYSVIDHSHHAVYHTPRYILKQEVCACWPPSPISPQLPCTHTHIPCISPFWVRLVILSYVLCVLSNFSPVWLFPTWWTVAHQAAVSMGFSRKEYWSVLPFPPPGDFSQPRDWTLVPCIGQRILYHWATREAPISCKSTHTNFFFLQLRQQKRWFIVHVMFSHNWEWN